LPRGPAPHLGLHQLSTVRQPRSITALCVGLGAASGKTCSGNWPGVDDRRKRRWSIPRTSKRTARRQA